VANSTLSIARKQVRAKYGKAFESKASDALVLSIAQPLAFPAAMAGARGVTFALPLLVEPETARGEAFRGALPAAAVQGGPSTAIIELGMPAPRRVVVAEASYPAFDRLSSTLAELGAASAADAASVMRRLHAFRLRAAFYQAAAPLREQIGRTAGAVTAGAPGTPISTTQMCWLNASMRTLANLPALADVAQDSTVQRIGLPRLLKPDARAGPEDLLQSRAYRRKRHVTGKDVVVAVLDSEIAYKHPAFGGRVILKENYTRESWGHPSSHGTAVAGLIAASSASFTGVAPEATIYHYKVLATAAANHADDFGGMQALQQALEDGAHIANCSWGIGAAGDGTSREARGFDQAWSLGLTIVKSAGNDGDLGLTSPADAAGAIVVGASDKSGTQIIPQSSRGPSVNGRRPDCVAPGGSSGDEVKSCKVDGRIGRVGFGTSFAAAEVAGVLALLLQKNRGQSPDELRAALIGLCHKLPGADDNAQGNGLVVLG